MSGKKCFGEKFGGYNRCLGCLDEEECHEEYHKRHGEGEEALKKQ